MHTPPKIKKIAPNTGRNQVHFIGIGGIGTSSLARYFLAQNWLVTGSDAVNSVITQELAKDGIEVKIGHKKSNLPKNAHLVIHTAAMPADNPEFKLAEKLGIKIQTYPQALGELTKKYKTIAIAGSHGKSSTTAMVATILIKAKMDPTVIIGTKINGWNFRAGKSEYLVIEADEYKGAFWNYYPYAAIVTNIDLEHVDFYKNLTAVKNSFLKFLKHIPENGHIILNGDNKNVASIIPRLKKGNIATFSHKDKKIINKIKKIIKVPGRHNIMNALAAFKLSKALGIEEEIILKALSSYKGVWRRIEYKGNTPEGYKVFDDYGHHPTEIKATLQAIYEKFPKKNIVCVFQPHQQKRLVALYKDFTTSFADADYILIPNVYNPKGRDELSHNINSESLAKDINKSLSTPSSVITTTTSVIPATSVITTTTSVIPAKAGIQNFPRAKYIGSLKNIPKEIKKLPLKKGDIIVMMGAGDIAEITPLLLKN